MFINDAEFRRLCMGMFGSLRSRGLKVMDARKNGAREGSVSIAQPVLSCTLGSLSNDDGDGNDNGKKSNRFRLAKQQLCICITLFVRLLAVIARLQRETA